MADMVTTLARGALKPIPSLSSVSEAATVVASAEVSEEATEVSAALVAEVSAAAISTGRSVDADLEPTISFITAADG